MKHHWYGGLPVLGFEADLLKTLVAMAADSIYMVIMGTCCGNLSDIDLDWIFSFFLEVTKTTIMSRIVSNFGQIRHQAAESAALECFEKSP